MGVEVAVCSACRMEGPGPMKLLSGGLQHVLCWLFASRMKNGVCVICRCSGTVVECTYHDCDNLVHVTCAKRHTSVAYDVTLGGGSNTLRRILCPDHPHKTTPTGIHKDLIGVTKRLMDKQKGGNLMIERAKEHVKPNAPFCNFSEAVTKRLHSLHKKCIKLGSTPDAISVVQGKKAFSWENDINAQMLSLKKAIA